MNNWKEYNEFCWEHDASQGSDDWKEVHIGRVSGYICSALAGRSNFKTPEEAGLIIAGVKENIIENKDFVEHGHKYEEKARKYYEKKYNCKVKERNFIIPKDPILQWLGVSVDGDVDNGGIIEIKCPQKMYKSILSYLKSSNKYKNYYNHIFTSYYDQMILGMKILGKKWCDYIVYCTFTNQVFIQRIPFNKKHWDNVLFPKLKENYEKYVLPHLDKSKYPISPGSS